MRRTLPLAILAALVTTPAAAADPGFYFGFDLGQSEFDIDQNAIDRDIIGAIEQLGLTVVAGESEVSTDAFSYGVFLGYQPFRFLAVEAAYVDLAEAEYKARVTVTDGLQAFDTNSRLTAESAGPTLSLLGMLPIGPWDLYARVGVYFADTDVSARTQVDDVSLTLSDSANTEEFLWGLGAGYTAGQWTLRLDYQQFTSVGAENSTGEVDVDRLVLGAVYRF